MQDVRRIIAGKAKTVNRTEIGRKSRGFDREKGHAKCAKAQSCRALGAFASLCEVFRGQSWGGKLGVLAGMRRTAGRRA